MRKRMMRMESVRLMLIPRMAGVLRGGLEVLVSLDVGAAGGECMVDGGSVAMGVSKESMEVVADSVGMEQPCVHIVS
jgi:hypothetical protein